MHNSFSIAGLSTRKICRGWRRWLPRIAECLAQPCVLEIGAVEEGTALLAAMAGQTPLRIHVDRVRPPHVVLHCLNLAVDPGTSLLSVKCVPAADGLPRGWAAHCSDASPLIVWTADAIAIEVGAVIPGGAPDFVARKASSILTFVLIRAGIDGHGVTGLLTCTCQLLGTPSRCWVAEQPFLAHHVRSRRASLIQIPDLKAIPSRYLCAR